MKQFQIVQFPDPILRRVCEPVDQMDVRVRKFIGRLHQVMKRQPGGVGIAAPQLGVMRQIAVVDISRRQPEAKPIFLINPVILEMSQYQILREGCMSVPDFTANVKRAKKIRFQSLNLEGKVECRTVRGFQAVAVQHEIDHLNGMLFLDRVACLNTDVFRRKRYL